MVEFRQAMRQAGISPPTTIYADGILHRFHVEGDKLRSENGWYVLHDSGSFQNAAFGWWKNPGESHNWTSREYKTFTDEEKSQIQRKYRSLNAAT